MNIRHLWIRSHGLLVGDEGLIVFPLCSELEAKTQVYPRGIGVELDNLAKRPIGK